MREVFRRPAQLDDIPAMESLWRSTIPELNRILPKWRSKLLITTTAVAGMFLSACGEGGVVPIPPIPPDPESPNVQKIPQSVVDQLIPCQAERYKKVRPEIFSDANNPFDWKMNFQMGVSPLSMTQEAALVAANCMMENPFPNDYIARRLDVSFSSSKNPISTSPPTTGGAE